MASMAWTICTEPTLSASFWPDDIHRSVITALGGKTDVSLSGQQRIDLEWSSVFLRVSGCLLAASVVCSWFRKATGARTRRSSKPVTPAGAAFDAMRDIAFPWVFAMFWLLAWFIATLSSWFPLLSFLATTSPLWLAMLIAGSANGLFGKSLRPDPVASEVHTKQTLWPELCVVLIGLLAWEATSFWMNERLYAGLLVPHGDSAMYEEHLWNAWHGKGFRSYLDQGLFLGEHIQVIHLLLLPLHMVWPSYLMMELLASLSLAICAIPIFSIALRHSGNPRAAMWLALAWLFFFPMHYLDIAIDIKTLRPSCYGLPFLFWGIDSAERQKLLRSSICFLIALSAQEDFSLVVGATGLVLYLVARAQSPNANQRRSMVWAAAVTAFSVAYLLLAVLVVIPAFRGGEAVHYSRYFGDLGSSPGDLIRTALREPMRVLSVIVSFRTLIYAAVLTVPLGCLTWRRPQYLLAGLPTFLMLTLLQLGNESGVPNGNSEAPAVSQLPPVPYHHFHAPLLPVILWAASAGLKSAISGRPPDHRKSRRSNRLRTWLASRWDSIALARFAFFCAAGTAVTGSMMPMGVNFWSKESPYGWTRLYVPGPRAAEFSKVLPELPETSRVASTDYVHTRLTHFERSYDYSDYPRAVNNYQPGVPDDTDYIVIDTSHPYSRVRSLADVRELQAEPEKWEVLPDHTGGLFLVLKRKLR